MNYSNIDTWDFISMVLPQQTFRLMTRALQSLHEMTADFRHFTYRLRVTGIRRIDLTGLVITRKDGLHTLTNIYNTKITLYYLSIVRALYVIFVRLLLSPNLRGHAGP